MASMPVFVRIDDYKSIIEVLDLLKSKLTEAKECLDKIAELKSKEDEEIGRWNAELDEVGRKVDFIDRTLFEPEAF